MRCQDSNHLGMMNKSEIQSILPHDPEFILVDEVSMIDLSDLSIRGRKNLCEEDHFFDGHFRFEKVFPAVFQIESMAKISGILAYYSSISGRECRLNQVLGSQQNNEIYSGFLTKSDISFRKLIKPDCEIVVYSRYRRALVNTVEFSVSVSVGEVCMSKGTLCLSFA